MDIETVVSNTKKLIYNPVHHIPWKGEKNKVYNKPELFFKRGLTKKRVNPKSVSKADSIRLQNIELLIMRFPGLKKYQAKAALTLSNNQLDKAIVLLEVSKSYQQNVIQNKDTKAYLKNIHINLVYDSEETYSTLRNVVYENFICPSLNESLPSVEITSDMVDASYSEAERSLCENVEESDDKVGVIIFKSPEGYKASLLPKL